MANPCIKKCTIKAALLDLLDQVPTIDTSNPPKLYVQSDEDFFHGDSLIVPFTKSVAFDVSGEAEIGIIETESVGKKLQIYITFPEEKSIRVMQMVPAIIPNQVECLLTQITIAKPFGYS